VREIEVSFGEQREPIFFPHVLGQRTTQWERGADPMTQFSFTGGYDAYGRPQWQLAIAVPRGRDYRQSAVPAEPYLSTYSMTTYAQRDDDERYIVDRAAGVTIYEVLNDGRMSVQQFKQAVTTDALPLKIIGQTP
jgi:hypothetical protein